MHSVITLLLCYLRKFVLLFHKIKYILHMIELVTIYLWVTQSQIVIDV